MLYFIIKGCDKNEYYFQYFRLWGSKYIEKLSEDLKEYGKGYSFGNLKYMAQFANNFSDLEIREQPARQIPWFTIIEIRALPVPQIPWGTIIEIRLQPVTQIPWSTLVIVILPKSNSHEEMLWYIDKTHKYCWSRAEVIQKFKLKAKK